MTLNRMLRRFQLTSASQKKALKFKSLEQREILKLDHFEENDDQGFFDLETSSNKIEEFLEACEDIEPGSRDLVMKGLIAQHYDVEATHYAREVIPYSQIRENVNLQGRVIKSFTQTVESYEKLGIADPNKTRNLEFLANSGILNSTETKIYLSAKTKIDQIYTVNNYMLNVNKFAHNKASKFGSVTFGTGVCAGFLVGGGFGFAIGVLGVFASYLVSDLVLSIYNNELTHSNQIAKHIDKYANDLTSDLDIVLEYGSILTQQLNNPTVISPSMKDRPTALYRKIDTGVKFLGSTNKMYHDLKNLLQPESKQLSQ